jgi:hypothetical protein
LKGRPLAYGESNHAMQKITGSLPQPFVPTEATVGPGGLPGRGAFSGPEDAFSPTVSEAYPSPKPSPTFALLPEGVRALTTRCLDYLDRQESDDVREGTRAVLRERGVDTDGAGRTNLEAFVSSEGFAALSEAEQSKLLLSTCGGGAPHVLLTMLRAKLPGMTVEQQRATLQGLVQNLPLPTRLEEPARATVAGQVVVDYGASPYVVPGPQGSMEQRTGHAYGTTVAGHAVTIVMPAESPAEGHNRIPSLTQVVRALGALPNELREGVEAVAICPARKTLRDGRELGTLADSGSSGMPGLVRFFPNEDWEQGLVDATLVHEAGHVLTTRVWGKEGRSFRAPAPTPEWAGWNFASQADPVSPSAYAKTAPTEDASETLRAWFLVRGTPLEQDLRALMPHRFQLLDKLIPSWQAG